MNEDELKDTIQSWRKQFWPVFDIQFKLKNTIVAAIRTQSAKRCRKVKSVNKDLVATQEYDFLKSMIYYFLFKNKQITWLETDPQESSNQVSHFAKTRYHHKIL